MDTEARIYYGQKYSFGSSWNFCILFLTSVIIEVEDYRVGVVPLLFFYEPLFMNGHKTWSILTDSLSEVFGCTKLNKKKDLEIYIFFLLKKAIANYTVKPALVYVNLNYPSL